MKKKRLREKLARQKLISEAMSQRIMEHYRREDELRDEIRNVKARSWDIISERT